jgi:hypothetical protein
MLDFAGRDRLKGGTGDERCMSTWDDSGGDVINGNEGTDIYFADAGDTVISGEESTPCFAE